MDTQEKNKSDDHITKFIDGMKDLSRKEAELSLKDRDGYFQKVIEETKRYAVKTAREEIKKETDFVKRDIFTLFGIFASFIAFIVGEISILKTIDSIYDKLGFSFIFVSLMIGFLFGIMFLINNENETTKSEMRVIFMTFFIIGIFFILLGLLN